MDTKEISPYAQKPWLNYYPSQVGPHINYPDIPLTGLLEEAAEKFPENTATVFLGAKLSYGDLWAEVNTVARFLADLGVKKGNRVALMLPNCPQAVIAYFGALLIGAIVVQNNPLYVEREIQHQLADSGSETIFVLDQLFPRIDKVRNQTNLKNIIIVRLQDYMPFPTNMLYTIKQKRAGNNIEIPAVPGLHLWKDLVKNPGKAPRVEVLPQDIALIQYTGGTTGVAKGAMLTHLNLLANTLQIKTWMLDGVMGQEKMMCALPFFHVYGMTVAMNVGISLAAELIILPRFEINMTLKAIKKYQPSFFPGAPTMYVAINNHPEVEKFNISSIRSCISGSAPLPLEVQETFERLTGGRLVEGYGLSESSPVTHCNPIPDTLRRNGTIGLPVPDTECKIVDVSTGEEVPVGEVGEVLVKGPQVMKGYWQRSEATAAALEDGWLHTGDIGVMDEKGYFKIVDRKKDVIIAGGFNIYPREVEEVLYQHPAIREVAVAGVEDSYRGETVKAYIVLKPGAQVSSEEIIKYSRERLAAFKVPRQIEFRDELPKTLIGKVLKRQLKEEEKK